MPDAPVMGDALPASTQSDDQLRQRRHELCNAVDEKQDGRGRHGFLPVCAPHGIARGQGLNRRPISHTGHRLPSAPRQRAAAARQEARSLFRGVRLATTPPTYATLKE